MELIQSVYILNAPIWTGVSICLERVRAAYHIQIEL